MARTDLQAHLAYLDSVASYHESLKRYFFPIIFAEATTSELKWNDAPRHDVSDDD